jgi:hypothetical protein
MSFLADMLACWPELVNNLDQEVSKLWPKLGARGKCPGNMARDFMSVVLRGCTTLPIYWAVVPVLDKTTGVERDVQFPFLLAHEFIQHSVDKMGDRMCSK